MSHVDVLNLAEYGTTAVFKGIKAGDRVYYRDRFGNRNSGKANALLLFPDHVVINVGAGRPQTVDASNYMKHTPKVKK